VAGERGSIDAIGVQATVDRARMFMEANNTPIFSLWQDKSIKFPYLGENVDDALQLLTDNLNAIAPTGVTHMYTLKFHPSLDTDGYIGNNSRVIASFNFRLNGGQYYGGQPVAPGAINGTTTSSSPEMAAILELLKRQDERMYAIEDAINGTDEDEMDEPERTEEDRIIGIVKQASEIVKDNQPLSDLVNDFRLLFRVGLKKFGIDLSKENTAMTATAPTTPPPAATADNGEKIKYAFTILMPLMPDLPEILVALANLSQNDPETFNLVVKKMRAAL
jgi:hypothetical protein